MFNFKEELEKFPEQIPDSNFTSCEKEISMTFEALNSTMGKLVNKQGAMNMQVEEMYSILEEQENTDKEEELAEENNKLVNTLIATADLVEDFYLYYREHHDEALTVQSAIMWNTLCKTLAVAGITRIADENTPFHMQLNTIEGITNDQSLPNSFIVNVLKSGYQYKDKVVRKATVIVNKTEENKE